MPGEWAFWECARCAVVFQRPMPTFEQLQSYYADYATTEEAGHALAARPRPGRLRRWYHRLTGDVDPRDFVPASRGTRILDYGCGAAPYLGHFRARGARVSGAEMTPAVVNACRTAGFDVALIEHRDRIPFPDDEFDIVYLMQVIEHIARPHEFLDEVRRVLKPRGTLYLAMPNAASKWRRLFGANWVTGWFAPFHLFVYSVPALRILGRAHGFTLATSRSITADSWLRLNLRAALHPTDNRLDAAPAMLLDRAAVRLPLALALRFVELFIRERDCLVVRLEKC
jgi:SAM-dependent methyltransferase